MNETTTKLELKELSVTENDCQLRCLRFSPCEKFLCAGTFDGRVLRWDASGEELQSLDPLTGHAAWVEAIAFSDDTLYSVDSWGMLAAWPYDAETFHETAPEPRWQHQTAHDGWIRGLSLSADGQRVATAGRDRKVRVWNAADGQLIGEFSGHEEEIFAVAIDPAGEHVVAGDLLGNLRMWNIASGECLREQRLEQFHYYDRDQDVAGLYRLAFHDDGNTLLCSGSQPTKIQNVFGTPLLVALDAKTWEVQAEHRLGVDKDGYLYDYAWHTEGHLIFLTSGGPGAGRLVVQQPGEEKPIFDSNKLFNPHALAYAPGRQQVAATATNRNSQGNGAVRDKEGKYVANTSPLHRFAIESVS